MSSKSYTPGSQDALHEALAADLRQLFSSGVQGVGMRTIHGFDEPFRIRPDQMHVYAYGYGKDFAASSVILCARMKVWPGRGLDARYWNKFPTGCGKAYDATLVARWLEEELQDADVETQKLCKHVLS
ncbi:unnamed protein product, partial [Cladocopium goreaui]